MNALHFLGRRDRARLDRLAAREGTTSIGLARTAVHELLRAADEWYPPRPRRPRRPAGVPAPSASCTEGEVKYRAGKRLWSAQEDERMRREFPDVPTRALARALGRTLTAVSARAGLLGLSKSAAYLASPHACRLRRGDNVGAAYRFPPGHVPANKGLRRPGWHSGRMRETQFQPGMRSGKAAAHHMPVGSTRLIDGYLYRKVSDVPGVVWSVNWKPEHVLLWTAAHGQIPSGYALAFKNHDRTDVRLDNVECLSRRDLMRRNSVHNLPKPLAETIQLLGALTRQIRRRDDAA